METAKTLVEKANAKINLGLDVIGVLPNGYHEVRMIMQEIGLSDTLTLEKTAGEIIVTTDSGELSDMKSNLVYRAAVLMKDTYHLEAGVKIHLEKHIPIAAGMAGGSTDAAAVFKGMNRLFDLNRSTEELMELSVSLGADIPFCILGGTALSEGIGERLTKLPKMPMCSILIAKPDINVSTKYVYEHLDSQGIAHHPDIDGQIAALETGDLAGIVSRLENVLEAVTVPAYPIITDIKNRMLELGADGALMSGSGPTVFGIFTDTAAAEEALRTLEREQQAKYVYLVSPVK